MATARSALARGEHAEPASAFEQLAVGGRVPARRIAGDCLGEVEAAPVRAAAQRPLDAAMLVAERDFQMDHPLAMAVEAEMPGLDDAGMHRTDRDLVDFGAGDREELRRRRWSAPPGGNRTGLSQGCPSGSMPILLANFALEVMRRRAIRASAPDRHPATSGGTDRDFAPSHHRQSPRAAEFRRRCPEARSAATAGHRARSRARTSRRNSAISRTGTSAIGSGTALRVVAKAHCGQPARTAAALPIASDSDSGIHSPGPAAERSRRRRSGAPNRALGARRWRTCGVAVCHVDQVPQRRDKDHAARHQEQHRTNQAPAPTAARSN